MLLRQLLKVVGLQYHALIGSRQSDILSVCTIDVYLLIVGDRSGYIYLLTELLDNSIELANEVTGE